MACTVRRTARPIDGLQKPEVIASSIWIPAPILPNTPTAQQAGLLARLDKATDDELHPIIDANAGIDPELDAAADRISSGSSSRQDPPRDGHNAAL